MEMIRKALSVETKEIAPHVLELIASTEDIDRDREQIKSGGWQLDNYRKNPVFLWAHDYKQPPIGKAVDIQIKDGKLVFRVEFAPAETYPFADVIYRLYKGGFLSATSVGFIPLEVEDEAVDAKDGVEDSTGPRRIYTKQELLEVSGVPVPSNPEALIQARSQGLITVKEFHDITGEIPRKILKVELIQLLEQLENRIAELEAENADLRRLPAEKPMPNEHACRVRAPGDFQPDSFRRMKREHEGKTYSVIMGRLKGADTMTDQALRYPKDAWKEDEAAAHCKGHKGSFEAASESEAVDVIIVEQATVCQSCLEIERLSNEANEVKEREAVNATLKEIANQAFIEAWGNE